ncbi:hypothetical protein [Serratia odorifera]|uniref:Ead/Ea22-like protein n=2 Tax=Serratia odorifera TaxID=618 RepID=D4DZ68_SEROD|nr:hypothetical protein [Serratia odorifera]EFE97126.1 hypothetical protein HMPREF0758_1218 [Serratia odorifera DSM 4582]PNK91654.1 hypothetical protein CEQ31_019220 [Serratia odorifera]RII72761.1 hypothetical protein DX901_07220 [Serratia odorifera]VDZ54944.1 Uncharacterised protein [Serratia odorifera]
MHDKLTGEALDTLSRKLNEGAGFYVQHGRRAGARTMANLLKQAGMAVKELQNRRKADGQDPVAVIISKYGDPEAFGEREIQVLTDIQKLPYGAKFYSQEYVSALLAELEAKDKRIADMERVVAAVKCDDELWDAMAHRLKTLEAKLATPVRLPGSFYPDGDIDFPLVVELDEVVEAIRAAGFTVEGDEQ